METLPNGKTLKLKIDHDSLKHFLEQSLSSKEAAKMGHKDVGL